MRLVSLKYVLTFCTLLCIHLSVFSNEITRKGKSTQVYGTINLDSEYVITISELFNKEQGEEYPLTSDGSFKIELELSAPTWFEVSFVPLKNDRQLGASFPLYLKPGEKLKLNLTYDKQNYLQLLPSSSKSANNALIEYGSFSNRTMRDLFNKRDNKEEYQQAVESYLSEVKALSTKYTIKNADITNYLTVWSYNNYLSVATTSKQIEIGKDRMESIPKIIDSEFMLTFWNGVSTVNNFVNALLPNERDPFARIALKKDKLNELFSNQILINSILKNDLERYVSSYKIANMDTFRDDIVRLEAFLNTLEDEELQQSILNDFKNLHYTSIGSEAPQIKFKDSKGKEVDLQQFKGKYIYIDLWASWCVPCIKEIPFLLELEEQYKDKDIVFVSISLDSDKDAWQKKMKELNLHGNQWELGDSNYDKLMNVSGIPHFLLYGPDGRLIQYKAPRPSSTEIKTIFNKI